MHRKPIISSVIRTAGFSNGVLEIEFHHGDIYRYFDVPAETADAFLSSNSKGQYFAKFIRDRYRLEKVTGHAPE